MSSPYESRPWLERYADYVPRELPPPEKSMADLFEESAARNPDRDAVRYFDASLSFAELDRMASALASRLASWGVERGDRVAVYTGNDPQFLISQHAAWKRGAVVVPLNPLFKARELDYHLNDSGAKVLICLESLYGSVAKEVAPETRVERVVTTSELDLLPEGAAKEIPILKGTEKLRFEDTEDLMEALGDPAGSPEDAREEVAPEDIAYLVYTSGTTGRPKGAVELHRNVAFNAEVYRTWMRIGDEDSVLGTAPLFHITGLVGHTGLAALAGVPLVLFHRFDPAEALRLIERWRPTMTVGAIAAFISMMNATGSGNRDISSLQKCYSSGAPVAPSVTERFEKKFGVYIHNAYGLTESNSPTHLVPHGSRAPVDPASGALSVGVPVPSCDARLVGLEDPDEEVAVGEAGEFAARGPMIFSEYWNRPEETRRAFHNGFFLTGDVAVMDEEGWFYIVDRKKDMINVSGYKVWPREVEDVLYTHPAVREAAVVGVPDAYRGETTKAYVALKEGSRTSEEEIIRYCRERMAAYKHPREVEFLEELPKTATGKFLRRELRDSAPARAREE
jgi:long-chain acyl-CoA synthetase